MLAALVVLVSAAAPLLTPWGPLEQAALDRLKPPNVTHLMGYDAFGRDILARVLYAGRISLLVGISSVALGGAVGVTLGLLAGYTGGKLETVIMRLIDVLMAFPSLLLGLAVVAVLGSGVTNVVLAIGIVLSPAFTAWSMRPRSR